MSLQPLRFSLALGAFVFALSLFAAQEADPANDPLPEGAKVRFGITRPILRTGPAVGLIPPGYKNFLAPTMTGGIRRYDLGTGRPLDKKSIVGPGQVVVSADGKRAAVRGLAPCPWLMSPPANRFSASSRRTASSLPAFPESPCRPTARC